MKQACGMCRSDRTHRRQITFTSKPSRWLSCNDAVAPLRAMLSNWSRPAARRPWAIRTVYACPHVLTLEEGSTTALT